ncbi:MAG: DUF47 domain-containing protein [Desulfovibrionaceae bacterium]
MSLRLPVFGLIAAQSPMEELTEHCEKILEGMTLIEEAMECYIGGVGGCPEFVDLTKAVEKVEEQADKIKRSIRNHMPRGLFMPVDKTLFLNYTRSQDNILDDGEEAMHWLYMRSVAIPEAFQKLLVNYLPEVAQTVVLLKPALQATIALVHGKTYDRAATKDTFRAVRSQHKRVSKMRLEINSAIYNSDMDFKDIHQLLHVVNCLFSMSHNAEGCADILRAMIAR